MSKVDDHSGGLIAIQIAQNKIKLLSIDKKVQKEDDPTFRP